MRVAGFAVASSFVLLLAGCGYVGPIMPPSPEIPAAVRDLAAVERGGKIEVLFQTPPRTTDNLPIKKFSEIDLRIGPAGVPFDFKTWSESAKVFQIPPPPASDPFDPKPVPLSASLPIDGLVGKRVIVAVRTSIKQGDHYSAWSNRVVLDVVDTVSTPKDIKIAASAGGIVLDWTAVQDADGYRILRQSPDELKPSEVGTTRKPHFVDETSQFDVPYSYSVLALHGSAESLPLKLNPFTAIDTFPPTVPSGVAALAGPESIEISWERSPEADTAGYFIYRSVDGAPFERAGSLVNLPAFSDRKIEHGKTYRYEISSVDLKNNESERSAPVEVSF